MKQENLCENIRSPLSFRYVSFSPDGTTLDALLGALEAAADAADAGRRGQFFWIETLAVSPHERCAEDARALLDGALGAAPELWWHLSPLGGDPARYAEPG